MQVQVQQRYSNALTTNMISYSNTVLQQFIIPESHTTLTLTKMYTYMTSPTRLSFFSNQHSFQIDQDQKGIFKASKEDECKGMFIYYQWLLSPWNVVITLLLSFNIWLVFKIHSIINFPMPDTPFLLQLFHSFFCFLILFLFFYMEGFHIFQDHLSRGLLQTSKFTFFFHHTSNLGFRLKLAIQTNHTSWGLWVKNKEGLNCTKFHPRKGYAQRGSSKVHTSHKVRHKRGILSNCSTLQNCCLRSFQVLASLRQADRRGKFEVSSDKFKLSSSPKTLTPISNETPHFY